MSSLKERSLLYTKELIDENLEYDYLNNTSINFSLFPSGDIPFTVLQKHVYHDYTDFDLTVECPVGQQHNTVQNKCTSVDVIVGRLDLISFEIYGSPYYWWLIAERNQIINPIDELYVGMILQIPSITDYFDFYNKNIKVQDNIDRKFKVRDFA